MTHPMTQSSPIPELTQEEMERAVDGMGFKPARPADYRTAVLRLVLLTSMREQCVAAAERELGAAQWL
jgi:hypothetical protein